MAATPPSRPLIKGPLRAPQQPPLAISYTQAPRMKSETEVHPPGSTRVAHKEVSLTTLPQPFVNPGDAFSQLKPPGRGEP
ncbi:hypothetical protein C8A01DRAFT_18200 [Parachaetomium inaequale]|uniref:Uncharacterized protein n=1 Tax=Parachaetomium inaequale TaxID=2588326 RepID=A0AAN6SNN0_9PEZI|nr:hypothetical protein C8A01DRAFT_18200 [Parachaetomium inaequale]